MTTYDFSDEFKEILKKISKKNPPLKNQTDKKIMQIIQMPDSYKTLEHVGGRYKRVHIGSFVLIFSYDRGRDNVTFHTLLPHDEAYKRVRRGQI